MNDFQNAMDVLWEKMMNCKDQQMYEYLAGYKAATSAKYYDGDAQKPVEKAWMAYVYYKHCREHGPRRDGFYAGYKGAE